MRIAVLSDTHGKLPLFVAEDIRSADEIWHLGDFTDPMLLSAVRRIGPPFSGVLGNCDGGIDLPERLRIERGGYSFLLIHIPPVRLEGADFLLHGHTHVARDEQVGKTRVLNPGPISRPTRGALPSYAWLEIDDAGRVDWRLVSFAR